MKHLWMIGALLALNCATYAQETEKYPLGDYTELTDTKPHDDAAKWNQLKQATQLSWGSIDVRYPKLSIPHVQSTSRWQGKAWRGERVNAQALLWSKTALCCRKDKLLQKRQWQRKHFHKTGVRLEE